jgi:hypothetical protein
LTPYIKPYLYILIDVIGSILGVSIIIGIDYTSLPKEGSEAGLITAVIIFAFFVAVSDYYSYLFKRRQVLKNLA